MLILSDEFINKSKEWKNYRRFRNKIEKNKIRFQKKQKRKAKKQEMLLR